jgi:hypothetical protein
MTHAEKMQELDRLAEKAKAAIDTIVKCKKEGNLKQVCFWIRGASQDMLELSKLAMEGVEKRRIIS